MSEDNNEPEMSRGTMTAWIVGAILLVGFVIVSLYIHYNRDPRFLECAGFYGPSLECKARVIMRSY